MFWASDRFLNQRWADLGYKKQHSGSKWKKPFAEASHAAGIVVEKVAVEAKQPNSAVRKCVRVQLKKNNKRITAYVPKDGGMSFCDENDEVLIAGFGRSGCKAELVGAGCGHGWRSAYHLSRYQS